MTPATPSVMPCGRAPTCFQKGTAFLFCLLFSSFSKWFSVYICVSVCINESFVFICDVLRETTVYLWETTVSVRDHYICERPLCSSKNDWLWYFAAHKAWTVSVWCCSPTMMTPMLATQTCRYPSAVSFVFAFLLSFSVFQSLFPSILFFLFSFFQTSFCISRPLEFFSVFSPFLSSLSFLFFTPHLFLLCCGVWVDFLFEI